jgi:diacylglycerol kinase family enzyme
VRDVSTPEPGIPVIVNAGAGKAQVDAATLRRELGPERVDVHAVSSSDFAGEIERAMRSTPPILGVAGGDGSLHSAAALIADTSTALLPIPTGTLNHFARRVGIASVAEAARALDDVRIQTLPVGTVHDVVFLNTLTLGEYSRIVRLRERYRGLLGKWPAAAIAFAVSCSSIRRFDATLSVHGRTFTRRTPFIWMGVGWGSFPRVHEALERRTEPDLEVAILRSDSAAASLAFVLRLGARMALRRQPVRDRSLELLHAREVLIDSRSFLDVTADGEVMRLQPPVRVMMRDHALRVVVGPGIPAGGRAT